VKQGVFYGRIDEEEEDEERKTLKQASPTNHAGDEIDEDLIKEQLRLKNHQHKPMLGLDESDESGEEGLPRPSRRQNNRRPTEQNRQSQSQIFL
jgi:hypothetical protein